jgi:carbon monoxide dehydrogenase subunit G
MNVLVERRPEAVWDVLADGWSYAEWVIGTETIRHVDQGWPAMGTSIQYRVAVGPLHLDDKTTVRFVQPGRHLQLEANFARLGAARVAIEILPWGEGDSVVTIDEHPLRGPAARLHSAPVEVLLRLRNRSMARNLARVVVARHP